MGRDLARFSSLEREAVLNIGCKIEVVLFVGRSFVPETPEVGGAHGFLSDALFGWFRFVAPFGEALFWVGSRAVESLTIDLVALPAACGEFEFFAKRSRCA